MHPTANSASLIESSNGFEVVCAAGDAGRYVSATRGINESSRRASIECSSSCVDNASGGLNVDAS
jgi:hypothetical protein